MKKNKTALPWVMLSVFIIALDQWSKYVVVTHLTEASVVRVLPFLNFILSFNAGSAFGFLNDQPGWQIYFLSIISVAVSLILVVWLFRIARSAWLLALPISLVLGGALGNLIDRIRFGYVIDFIDFHVKNWHYATFNVADSFVCVGAVCLILQLLHESFSKNMHNKSQKT